MRTTKPEQCECLWSFWWNFGNMQMANAGDFSTDRGENMQIFFCDQCDHRLFFENTSCENCGVRVGIVEGQAMRSVVPDAEQLDLYRLDESFDQNRRLRLCANATHNVCNWLVDEGSENYCLACRHNLTIPSLGDLKHLRDWRRMEWAKHRLFYTLIRLALPLTTRQEDSKEGLGFDFLSTDSPDTPEVMTGHANGLITIDLAEADDAERERRRTAMGEPYRTLLGHFRHEAGHWYWDRLARDGDRLDFVRSIFGDDRADYGEALKRHYEKGALDDWQQEHVSTYATAHPWEDFAETWAHYLHIIDTLDTVRAVGITLPGTNNGEVVGINLDPYALVDFGEIIALWSPITVALNAINRSMGLPDLYPFVLSPMIVAKLAAIHSLVHER